ncbi:MAG: hypothetical protein Q7N95_11670 [Alphaproteobacteria bacterium]|nr:hypothetical protein [Alphaproteobacteria bacterium]
MSVLLFDVNDDRAMVAVDTLAGIGASAPATWTPVAKLHVISHLGLVLAGRGVMEFNAIVARHVDLMPGPGLDQVAAQLEATLPQVLDVIARANPSMADGLVQHGSELVLAGYSASMRTWVAYEFSRAPGSMQFKTTNDTLSSANPYPRDHLGDLPPLDNELDFVMCARRQVEAHRKLRPHEPVGGSLILATLTRDAVTVRNLGDLE